MKMLNIFSRARRAPSMQLKALGLRRSYKKPSVGL